MGIIIRFSWYWFQRIFLIILLLSLTVWLAWWLSQKPTLYKDWDPMDAVLPEISWSGETVTIAHIRDNEWRSETEYTPRCYTGVYALADIESLHYVITPFSDHDGPAHTMLTFSFSGGRHLAISAEIRKVRGQTFDAIDGILNQYQIAYVIAIESDVIKLRTNYRKNEVYMYPIKTEKEKIQLLFRSMLIKADRLTREPEFYNTLWNNCTTSILDHANSIRIDKLIGGTYRLLPSHSDEIVYAAGLIDTQLSLADARAYYRIDELTRSATGSTDFSTLIRKPIK
jgi:Domain of unknown function (DUF4105)